MSLSFDRIRAELPVQTAGFLALAEGADLSKQVPTCPDWTHADLLRHVGTAQSLTSGVIRSAAGQDETGEPLPAGEDVPDEELAGWVRDVVARMTVLADTTPPETMVANVGLEESVVWWIRRAMQDVVIHRADAAATVGEPYELDREVAEDAVDELLDVLETMRGAGLIEELHGSGTIHLHATDTEAEWMIELTDKGFAWRRGHEKGDVALRGPLTEILLTLYRRRSLDDGSLEVLGDGELLDFWLDHASFG